MTFVVIPAGEYKIGSLSDEPGRDNDEILHTVRIARPFAILDREVTWRDVALSHSQTAKAMKQVVQDQVGWTPESNHPSLILTWYESVGFCRWLSRQVGLGEDQQAYANPATLDKTKYPRDPHPQARGLPRNWPLVSLERRGFRLPTEAEWEIACRAGTLTGWSFGGDVGLLDHYAWYEKNSLKGTRDVRSQRPNLRGLFGFHGNASEWCHDWYGDYPAVAVDDPQGPASGLFRVHRGGSWGARADFCRSANRTWDASTDRNVQLGFRLVSLP